MNLRIQSVTGKGTSLKASRKTAGTTSDHSAADCFVGTPCPEDLRNAKYPLILQPLITGQDAESHVHALEWEAVPTQKGRSPYVPIRFVPFEKISKHYKLMQG